MNDGFKGVPYELYEPSNGTEAMIFMESFCDRCLKQPKDPNEGCPILGNTLFYSIDDPKYSKEWQYNKDGQPVCTAFERDWKSEIPTNDEGAN